jgi:hypothetical protein
VSVPSSRSRVTIEYHNHPERAMSDLCDAAGWRYNFVRFSETQSAKQIQQHDNQQDRSADSYASAPSPSRISIVAAASTEQQHEKNKQ